MENLRKLKISNSILILLIVVLLLAQTVVAIHKVAHARGAVELGATEHSSFMNLLWGDHSNSSDCKTFDQNCPDQFAFTTFQSSLIQVIQVWVVIDPKSNFSKFERFFSAQAPPVSLK